MDTAESKLIVALDVTTDKEAFKMVDILKGKVKIFKVGYQLFMKYGPEIVMKINKKGMKVFLDLKFHDIPNTVASGVEAIVPLGVYMFNVHTLGGVEMMKSAAYAGTSVSLKLGIPKPIILGVTILTSIDQQILARELGIRRNISEHVVHLARLAKESGLDGVVASPLEVDLIRRECGDDFIIVTPGIRPLAEGEASDDQKRVLTPRGAVLKGADLIVVGRPVIKAGNPVESAAKIIEEINLALEQKSRENRRTRGIMLHTSTQSSQIPTFKRSAHVRNYQRKPFFKKFFKKKGGTHNAESK